MENNTPTPGQTAAPFNPGIAYSDFKKIRLAYLIAACTAYLLSAYFVVGYFAGHLRVWEWDYSQWAQAIPSAGLVGIMTAYQYFLYSQGDTAGGKKATYMAVFVAVAFSLLSEVGQGMERDNIRMETKSQESPAYKALVASLGNAAGASYNPYANDLQNAQVKLAQCQQRLAQGKEKHCEGAKARVDAVNQMVASSNTATQNNALADKAKTMERDEKNYHPLVNLIRETLGATAIIASFMVSLTLIAFFEYAFHYLGGLYAKKRATLMQHGFDVTRRLRQPPRRHDGSMTTYSSAFVAAGEAIATEMGKAQQAREQLYQSAADRLDAMGNTQQAPVPDATQNRPTPHPNAGQDVSDDITIKESSGFRQSPEQLANAMGLAQGQTYREELRHGSQQYRDMPLDAQTAKPTAPQATLPHDQQHGRTGGSNPVLGTAEVQHQLPLPAHTSSQVMLSASSQSTGMVRLASQLGASSPETDLLAAIKEAKAHVSATVLRQSVGLYPVWLGKVAAREITPAKKPAHALMSEHWCRGGKDVTVTPPQMDRIWAIWQARATKDGVLMENPKYQPGNRQPRYMLAG